MSAVNDSKSLASHTKEEDELKFHGRDWGVLHGLGPYGGTEVSKAILTLSS